MRRTNWLAAALAGLAVAIAVGGTVYNHAFVETAATGTTLAEQVAEVCARGGQAAAELGKACEKADEVKDAPAVAQPPTPDPEMVRQAARTAVAEYCAAVNRPCRGADGASPNFDLIVDAVVGRIPKPANGADGDDGADATGAQIAEAVAAYCGQTTEPCRGTPGTPGTNGAAGQPGPTCPDGYELRDAVITAHDGTTYSGKACVDPASSAPPSSNPPLPLGG